MTLTSSSPLVLLPGMLCDAQIWRDAVEDITAPVTIIPALRGGTVEIIAQAVLRHAPPRFALGGLSMGGYVALAILRLAPQRVSRLLLANTSARADTARQQAGRQAAIADARAGRFDQLIEQLLPLLVHPGRHGDGLLLDRLRAMMRRVGAEVFIEQQTATASRVDSRAFLETIAVPTIVVGGEGDRIVPPDHAVELAAGIPFARLEMLQSCGHLSPAEQPGRLRDLLANLIAD